jgi:hypothetical protein
MSIQQNLFHSFLSSKESYTKFWTLQGFEYIQKFEKDFDGQRAESAPSPAAQCRAACFSQVGHDPLAQHCCGSNPLGLAGRPASGERPTAPKARSTRALAQQCPSAPAMLAANEGVLRWRDCDMDSSGTRTSARWPHRWGEKAGDVEPHRLARLVGESGAEVTRTLLGRRRRDEWRPAREDREGDSGGDRLQRKMRQHGEGGGAMALLAEEWRRSRTMRRWWARTMAVQRSRTVSSGTGFKQGSRSERAFMARRSAWHQVETGFWRVGPDAGRTSTSGTPRQKNPELKTLLKQK